MNISERYFQDEESVLSILKDAVNVNFVNCEFDNVEMSFPEKIKEVSFSRCDMFKCTLRAKVKSIVFRQCQIYNSTFDVEDRTELDFHGKMVGSQFVIE